MSNDGEKAIHNRQELEQHFVKPAMKFAPYQFWFWDQDVHTLGVKPVDMARMMFEKGFNPGYAHARENYAMVYGKKTSDYINPLSKEQWLTESWFNEFIKVVKQAHSDDSHFSFADEYGWPSLQAAGTIVAEEENMSSRSLRFSVTDVKAGQQAALPVADFTTYAKVACTEKSNYVEYYPDIDSWGYSSSFFENTLANDVSSLPLNIAMRYSEGTDGSKFIIIRPYFTARGKFKIYVRWSNTGENTTQATYHIVGEAETKVTVDQSKNFNLWNLLGEYSFEQGDKGYIKLDNHTMGKVVFDAVKLVNCNDADEIIVIDDWHTTNRVIACLDSNTLKMMDPPLTSGEWTAPDDGDYRVYSFSIIKHRGYDGGTVDYLNKSLADKVIEKAYKPYFEKMKEYMGNTMNGVFSDCEGDYGYKMAWSDDLSDTFREKTGEDIRRMLPLLIDRDINGMDAKIRYAWFDAVSDIYSANFHTVSEYAKQQGMYFTMHTWEESLQLQASCVGDYFKMTRGLTMPGTDCLIDSVYNSAMFKETLSIAEFENRRFMTEVMALLSLERYHPTELKKQANCMAAWGVSHIITHAVKMTRDMAQEIVTPDFYTQDTMWNYVEHWTNFMRRTSFINSNGIVNAKVLLLNPMDTVWALAENDVFDMKYIAIDTDGSIPKVNGSYDGKVSEINRIYTETIRILTNRRVEHLIADKHYLNKMTLSGDALVYDQFSFQAVIMPPMTIIDRQSAEVLVNFAKAGGYVYYLGQLPQGSIQIGRYDTYVESLMNEMKQLENVSYLADFRSILNEDFPYLTPQIKFISEPFPMLMHYRLINGKHFIWVVNNNDEDYHSVLYLPNLSGQVTIWNPEDGTVQSANARIHDLGIELKANFMRYQGFYIVIDPEFDIQTPATTSNTIITTLNTSWRASIAKSNPAVQISHEMDQPVYANKIRVVCQKGSFINPNYVFISNILINGHEANGKIHVSSEDTLHPKENINDFNEHTYWSNKMPLIYDEVAWIELELNTTVQINSIAIKSKEEDVIRKYRIESWDGEWWRTLVSVNNAIEPELMNPITYPEELISDHINVLTNWKEWGVLDEKFSGFIDYDNTFKLGTFKGNISLDLGKVKHLAEVWMNDVWIGSRMWSPFVFDITNAVHEGVNHIKVRIGNLIAENAGIKTGECGLLGPVIIKEESSILELENRT